MDMRYPLGLRAGRGRPPYPNEQLMQGNIIAVLYLVIAIGCSRTGERKSRREAENLDFVSAQASASLLLFDIKTHQPHLYEQMKGHWVKLGYLAARNKESNGRDPGISDFRRLIEIEVLVGSDPIEVRAVDCCDPPKYRYFE